MRSTECPRAAVERYKYLKISTTYIVPLLGNKRTQRANRCWSLCRYHNLLEAIFLTMNYAYLIRRSSCEVTGVLSLHSAPRLEWIKISGVSQSFANSAPALSRFYSLRLSIDSLMINMQLEVKLGPPSPSPSALFPCSEGVNWILMPWERWSNCIFQGSFGSLFSD